MSSCPMPFPSASALVGPLGQRKLSAWFLCQVHPSILFSHAKCRPRQCWLLLILLAGRGGSGGGRSAEAALELCNWVYEDSCWGK